MEGSTEKFGVRWNDFESNMSSAFQELREEKDFFDVTLACEDEQVGAHKVILSACSHFFHAVLRRNPHSHPLLYLKGVKFAKLLPILDFMYRGQVDVAQDDLNSFLALAEDLKVKNLSNNITPHPPSNNFPPLLINNNNTPHQPNINIPNSEIPSRNNALKPSKSVFSSPLQHVTQSNPIPTRKISAKDYNQIDEAQPNSMVAVFIKEEMGEAGMGECNYPMVAVKELKEDETQRNDYVRLKGYIIKGSVPGCFICQKCGTKKKQRAQIYHHLETQHFQGQYVYECHLCAKSFNGRMSYRFHMSKVHNRKRSKYFGTI